MSQVAEAVTVEELEAYEAMEMTVEACVATDLSNRIQEMRFTVDGLIAHVQTDEEMAKLNAAEAALAQAQAQLDGFVMLGWTPVEDAE